MRLKCLGLAIALIVPVGLWQVQAQPCGTPFYGPRTVSAPMPQPELLRHGEYLANNAIMCVNCHTPKDDQGKLDRTRLLRGPPLPIRPKKETKVRADEA